MKLVIEIELSDELYSPQHLRGFLMALSAPGSLCDTATLNDDFRNCRDNVDHADYGQFIANVRHESGEIFSHLYTSEEPFVPKPVNTVRAHVEANSHGEAMYKNFPETSRADR